MLNSNSLLLAKKLVSLANKLMVVAAPPTAPDSGGNAEPGRGGSNPWSRKESKKGMEELQPNVPPDYILQLKKIRGPAAEENIRVGMGTRPNGDNVLFLGVNGEIIKNTIIQGKGSGPVVSKEDFNVFLTKAAQYIVNDDTVKEMLFPLGVVGDLKPEVDGWKIKIPLPGLGPDTRAPASAFYAFLTNTVDALIEAVNNPDLVGIKPPSNAKDQRDEEKETEDIIKLKRQEKREEELLKTETPEQTELRHQKEKAAREKILNQDYVGLLRDQDKLVDRVKGEIENTPEDPESWDFSIRDWMIKQEVAIKKKLIQQQEYVKEQKDKGQKGEQEKYSGPAKSMYTRYVRSLLPLVYNFEITALNELITKFKNEEDLNNQEDMINLWHDLAKDRILELKVAPSLLKVKKGEETVTPDTVKNTLNALVDDNYRSLTKNLRVDKKSLIRNRNSKEDRRIWDKERIADKIKLLQKENGERYKELKRRSDEYKQMVEDGAATPEKLKEHQDRTKKLMKQLLSYMKEIQTFKHMKPAERRSSETNPVIDKDYDFLTKDADDDKELSEEDFEKLLNK